MGNKVRVRKYSDKEKKEAKGYTFAMSNVASQPITGGGELSFFDDEYSSLTEEEVRQLVDCETGLPSYLTQQENDILTYIAQLIDERRNDPEIKEFVRTLPRRISERKEERRGGPRLVLKKYPVLEGVNIKDIIRAKYGSTQGAWKVETISRALYSVSRKGYPFAFKRKGGEIIRELTTRFFHISNPNYVKVKTEDGKEEDKTIALKVSKKKKDGKVMVKKSNTEIKVIESCDIIVEDAFLYIASGYFRQPSNIFELKRDAKVPNNELFEFIFYYLVRKFSHKVKEYVNDLKETKMSLKQNATLTTEEIEAQLNEYERKYFTIKVSVPYIMERLRGTSYHHEVRGVMYPYTDVLDEQLPEVVRSLKDMGLVKEHYEKNGGLGEKVLYFYLNRNWYSEQKASIQQLPTPKKGEEVEYEEVVE